MSCVEIWVINLARSKDRWKKISKSLDRYKIKYKRFDAIDGQYTPVPKYTQPSYWLTSPGMRGCYLSHYKLWNQLLQSSSQYFLILEDDAIIHPNLLDILDSTIKSKPHFFYISLFNVTPTLKKQGIHQTYIPLTTTGYLLSKQGVQMFSRIMPKEPIYHVDMIIAIMTFFHRVPMYELLPYPISTDYTDSTIINYRSTFINVWALKLIMANPAQLILIHSGDLIVIAFMIVSFMTPTMISIILLIIAIVVLVLTHSHL